MMALASAPLLAGCRPPIGSSSSRKECAIASVPAGCRRLACSFLNLLSSATHFAVLLSIALLLC